MNIINIFRHLLPFREIESLFKARVPAIFLFALLLLSTLTVKPVYSQSGSSIQPQGNHSPYSQIPVEHLTPQNPASSNTSSMKSPATFSVPQDLTFKEKSNPEEVELKRPANSNSSSISKSAKPNSQTSSLPALACCIIILLVFWMATLTFKKKSPLAAPGIPSEALEFLGRKSIDLKSSIYYLRCGSRILIIGHSEAGLQTLGEVADPLEVDIISGLCRAEKAKDSSITESFKTLFLRTQTVDSPPAPTSSLRDRLQKNSSATSIPPGNREGRISS